MAGGEKTAGPGAFEQGTARDLSRARPPPCSAAVVDSGMAAPGSGFILGGAPDSCRSVGAGLGGSQWRPGRLDVASWRRRARRSTVKLPRPAGALSRVRFRTGRGILLRVRTARLPFRL